MRVNDHFFLINVLRAKPGRAFDLRIGILALNFYKGYSLLLDDHQPVMRCPLFGDDAGKSQKRDDSILDPEQALSRAMVSHAKM
jgi:hypothetical protein